MDILAKFGIRYGQQIDSEMINSFVLKNISLFNNIFTGLSHPLQVAKYFKEHSKSFLLDNIDFYQREIESHKAEIVKYQERAKEEEDNKNEYIKNSFFTRIFKPGKYADKLSSFDYQIKHNKDNVKWYLEYLKNTEEKLHELQKQINYWEIFHEVAMDAYAELVALNSMHQHLDIDAFYKMQSYYLSAEGLNDSRFDMKKFMSDGIVNTVFAISDSALDQTGCSIGESINKLCNITEADHIVRKHIFTRLLGVGLNFSLLTTCNKKPVLDKSQALAA